MDSILSYTSIDEDLLKMQSVIPAKIASEDFNEFLSFYGLKPKSLSSSKEKLWRKCLILLFWISLIKAVIIFNVDPVKDYILCIYLGDFTLLFKSLRKYFIIVWLLLSSFGIQLNSLFAHHSNTESFHLFKCLDGSLTPKSIGISNKNILKKILILTKFSLKMVKVIDFGFSFITACLCLYLSLKQTNVSEFELTWFLVWFPITIFKFNFFGGTILVSNFCFNLICFYCLMDAMSLNQKFNYNATHHKEKVFIRCKTFIMKIKLKYLLKQQNHLSNRIGKYNEFWRKVFLVNIIHFIPGHIIVLQQILFGNLKMELQLIYVICCFFATLFIASSPLIVSLLYKEMKLHSKKLIQIQFNPNFNFDINTRIKVSQFYIRFNYNCDCNFNFNCNYNCDCNFNFNCNCLYFTIRY